MFRKVRQDVEHLVFKPGLEELANTVRRKISLFGSGEDPRSIYRIGRFRSLVGRKIEQLAHAGTSDLELELKAEWSFEEVDLDGPFIPAHIAGQIVARQRSPDRLHLALAMNGRIEAVTQTYQGPESVWSFTAIVPETVFNQDFRFGSSDGTSLHPHPAKRNHFSTRKRRWLRRDRSSPLLPLMGADTPLRSQFRRHPSELPSSVHRFHIRQVRCYPPGTGSAQILRSMSPNSLRFRCPSANKSQ